MKVGIALGAGAAARLAVRPRAGMGFRFHNRYQVECRGSDGGVKWRERVKNLVVNQGLDDVLDKYFKGSGYTAAHYVGLKGSGAIAAGDTMASHAGWSEITAYSEAARQTLALGLVSGQSVDNSASKAVFSINGSATVAGLFIATDSSKGGTSGTLYGAADFSSARSVVEGDTLNITATLTAG